MVIVAAMLLRIARVQRIGFFPLFSTEEHRAFMLETLEKVPDCMEPVYPAA